MNYLHNEYTLNPVRFESSFYGGYYWSYVLVDSISMTSDGNAHFYGQVMNGQYGSESTIDVILAENQEINALNTRSVIAVGGRFYQFEEDLSGPAVYFEDGRTDLFPITMLDFNGNYYGVEDPDYRIDLYWDEWDGELNITLNIDGEVYSDGYIYAADTAGDTLSINHNSQDNLPEAQYQLRYVPAAQSEYNVDTIYFTVEDDAGWFKMKSQAYTSGVFSYTASEDEYPYLLANDMEDILNYNMWGEQTFFQAMDAGQGWDWLWLYTAPGSDAGYYPPATWYNESLGEWTIYGVTYDHAREVGWGDAWLQLMREEGLA